MPAYIRPLFCEGKGPFRWVALSGDPADIARTDRAVLELFPENAGAAPLAQAGRAKRARSRACPRASAGSATASATEAGLAFNELVRTGEVKAPIVIGRDHLDCGSVASPNRETEAMKDGTDAVADWPILNALVNAVNGASWVCFHHGGGVGIGYSLHAGQVIVADGTDAAARAARARAHLGPGHGRAAPRRRGLPGGRARRAGTGCQAPRDHRAERADARSRLRNTSEVHAATARPAPTPALSPAEARSAWTTGRIAWVGPEATSRARWTSTARG